MIQIQEVATAGQFITLLKPVGKEISLRLGEIVEGQVVDIFPAGGLTIKVKGGFLPARTGLNFQKDQNILLKVSDQRGPNGELILQLIDQKSGPFTASEKTPAFSNTRQQAVEFLTRQISDLMGRVTDPGKGGVGGAEKGSQETTVENGKLINLLESLLKALPPNSELIPRTLKAQLQQILQYSLAHLGQDVPKRVAQLLTQMAEDLRAPLLVQNLKDRLLVSMDGLISSQLKAALENSGVALEAKLKALVEAHPSDVMKINKDLKAVLLQLKGALGQEEEGGSPAGLTHRMTVFGNNEKGEVFQAEQKVLSEVDGLLKDLATFQLLSKISDSFWTFLPVQWKELRNGDLVFKRRTAPNGDASYTCGIHLDLEKRGRVSIFIVQQFRDFLLTFKIDHPGLKAQVDSHLKELKENFKSAGLTVRNISLLDNSEKIPDPFEHPESGETIVSIRI
jgi:hypothetical protein